MVRWSLIVCASLGLLLAGRLASAQSTTEVLNQLPKSIWAVGIVNNIEATSALTEKLGGQLRLPIFNPLGLMKIVTGIQGGMDDKGCAAVAWLPGVDGAGPPVPIFLIPVTDYDKFIDPLVTGEKGGQITNIAVSNRPFLAGHKGNFAVLSMPETDASLKSFLEAKESSVEMFAPLGGWLSDNEVVTIATPAGIRAATERMSVGLNQARDGLAGAGPAAQGAVIYFKMIDTLLTAVRAEVALAAVGINLGDDGHLTISLRSTFLPSGTWAADSQHPAQPTKPLLTGLPPGRFVLASGSVYLDKWTERKLNFANEMLRASFQSGPLKLTDDQVKQLTDGTTALARHSRQLGMWFGVASPDQGLFSKSVSIIDADSSTKYMDAVKSYMAAYEKLTDEVDLPTLPRYETQSIQIGNKTAVEMTIDISKMFEKLEAQGLPGAAEIVDGVLRTMFGPTGKLTAYAMPLDDHRVLTSYSRESLEAYIAAPPKSGSDLADDELVKKTIALLPPGSQSIALLSLRGAIDMINVAIRPIPAAQGFQLPKVESSPPIGFGSHLSAQGYELRIVAPAEAMSGIGALIATLRELGQQGGRPGAPKEVP
ncbi:MAG TPA: hypothetical protein VHV77_08035 [Pirellulales bacterium]|nr:hypothetical protein [Pirellulales bacterium]